MMRRGHGDRELGGALRSLPVPEHADDFFDRLREQLVAEYLDSSAAPTRVTELSGVRRAPQQHTQPRLRRLLAMATAPAAAVACFALVVGGAVVARDINDRESTTATGRDTAGQPLRPAARRLTTIAPHTPSKTGMRVEFIMRGGERDAAYQATVSPSGDYLIRRKEPFVEISHDAKADRRLTHVKKAEGTQYEQQTGIANGAPEPELSTPDLQLSRDLGAAVRAIAAEQPDRVTEITHNGRAALQLKERIEPTSFPVDEITYVVDRETGYPLQILQTVQGKFYREMAVEDMAGVSLDRSSLALTVQPAAALSEADHGHRDVSLAEATELTDEAPLVPGWAPDGYRLDRVTLAMELAPRAGHNNPLSRQLLSLLYRRGYDSFTITTRLARPHSLDSTPLWSNPLLQGTPLPDRTEPTTLRSGAMSGTEARVGIYPLVWPHLWAQNDELVLTIAGDLTRAELVRIAESLAPYDGG
jgi:hypothetical protein